MTNLDEILTTYIAVHSLGYSKNKKLLKTLNEKEFKKWVAGNKTKTSIVCRKSDNLMFLKVKDNNNVRFFEISGKEIIEYRQYWLDKELLVKI